jgi:moderate conductance mechanosensitive channel
MSSTLVNDIFLTAAEFFALALLFGGLAFGLGRLLRLAMRVRLIGERLTLERAQRTLRGGLLLLFLLATAALLIFNVSIMLQGRGVREATVELLTTALPPGFWGRLAWALVQVIALVALARVALRLVVRSLPAIEGRIRGLPSVRITEEQLRGAFALVRQTLQIGVWLLVGFLCARILGLPAGVAETLAVALRILLIIQLGRLLIGLLGTIINTLDALSEKYLRSRQLDLFYDQLRGVVPLISRALQYIILVQALSLALAQIAPLSGLASYGTRAIQVIGIVFLGLVLIEILRLVVDALYLVRGDLSDAQWQQRLTFGPLLKNVAQYAVLFGGGLLVLTALGFNIGPILVGLGGLGLVVGPRSPSPRI